MKKCLIYGNCQTGALKKYLQKCPQFSSQYEFINLKAVHLLSQNDVPFLEEIIPQVDLFIHQPIGDKYKGISQLGTNYLKSKLKLGSKIISFPVAYFMGYNPEMVYFRNTNKGVIDKPFPYHDLNILKSYQQGKSVSETLSLIEDDNYYDPDYVKNNLEKTLRTLSQREKDLDIQLSDFIESNFRKVKLFHSFNHPNCTILAYIANTILKHLEIDTFFSLETEPDLLSTISFPLYSSLRKHLTINFIENEKYFLRQEYFSRENIIQLFFDYYKSHPDLVKLNLEFYQ